MKTGMKHKTVTINILSALASWIFCNREQNLVLKLKIKQEGNKKKIYDVLRRGRKRWWLREKNWKKKKRTSQDDDVGKRRRTLNEEWKSSSKEMLFPPPKLSQLRKEMLEEWFFSPLSTFTFYKKSILKRWKKNPQRQSEEKNFIPAKFGRARKLWVILKTFLLRKKE